MEFYGAFAKNSNFYSIDFFHFFAKQNKKEYKKEYKRKPQVILIDHDFFRFGGPRREPLAPKGAVFKLGLSIW